MFDVAVIGARWIAAGGTRVHKAADQFIIATEDGQSNSASQLVLATGGALSLPNSSEAGCSGLLRQVPIGLVGGILVLPCM